MIPNIVLKPYMLENDEGPLNKMTVELWQSIEDDWQPTAQVDRQAYSNKMWY